MSGEWANDRAVLSVTGTDATRFLQDLVTNDLKKDNNSIVYAALLSAQGKYLFDFFVIKHGDGYLIDIDQGMAAAFAQRLTMYRLRADVVIAQSGLVVNRGVGEAPEGALPDPRHPALGWRAYAAEQGTEPTIDWAAIRVAHCIPASGIELIPNESYILECGFERLNGVNFRKGCYVGQEVTARMKHKTELRKGLRRVALAGEVPVGTEITAAGKPVGTVYTQSNGQGIAYLRLDRAGEDMDVGGVAVTLID